MAVREGPEEQSLVHADSGDLAGVTAAINAANQEILFLMSDPGPRDSALNAILDQSRVDTTRRRYIVGATRPSKPA